jgi:ATP-dependent Clp endopeptidase proteolytic subunit ClpP
MTTWFTFTNLANEQDNSLAYAISIHDVIGAWGKPANEFMAELNAIPLNARIKLSVHSPGGSLMDGLAIYHAMLPRSQMITATVEGIAASAASLILMAAGKRIMPENAWMMIHNTQNIAIGESKDFREIADLMDRFTSSINAIYSARTGQSAEQITNWMNATTWMDGKEALSNGFVDETVAPLALAAQFDERSFELNVPEQARALLLAKPFNATSDDDHPNGEELPAENSATENPTEPANEVTNFANNTPPTFNLTEYTAEITAIANAANVELGVQNMIDARVPVDAARACFLAISEAMTANINAAHGDTQDPKPTSVLNVVDVYENRRTNAARYNFKGV